MVGPFTLRGAARRGARACSPAWTRLNVSSSTIAGTQPRQRRQHRERQADFLVADGGEEKRIVFGVTERIFRTQGHDASCSVVIAGGGFSTHDDENAVD
jgi:hypothetical protein